MKLENGKNNQISSETHVENSSNRGIIGGEGNQQYIQNFYEANYEKYLDQFLFSIEDFQCQNSDLEVLEKIFIEPDGFQALKTQIQNRIIFLSDEAEIGKLSSALYIGITLKMQGIIDDVFLFPDCVPISGNILLNKIPRRSLLIIDNAFEGQENSLANKIFGRGDLSRVLQIRNSLKNSFIIATIDRSFPHFVSKKTLNELNNQGMLVTNLGCPQALLVFEKHLNFRFSEENNSGIISFLLNDNEVKRLIKELEKPYKIRGLVDNLWSKQLLLNKCNNVVEFLKEEAKRIYNFDNEVEEFFSQLSLNGKIMAATIGLFYGCTESELWYFYKHIANISNLKQEEQSSNNIFSFNKAQILGEIKAEIFSVDIKNKSYGTSSFHKEYYVKFKKEYYHPRLLDYIISHYPNYFSDVILYFIDLLKKLPENSTEGKWICKAIGRIAHISWPDVNKFIEECIYNEPSKTSFAILILESSTKNPLISNVVEEMLYNWASLDHNEGNLRYIYCATCSYDAIGQYNLQTAIIGLKQIISKLDVENNSILIDNLLDPVLNAMLRLVLTNNFSPVLQLLKDLLDCDEQKKDSAILTIASIWYYIASFLIHHSHKSGIPNEILVAISEDETLFCDLANFCTDIFIRLYSFKFNGQPFGKIILQITADWILSTDKRNRKTAILFAAIIGKELRLQNNICFKYYKSYLQRMWLGKRQNQYLRIAARYILFFYNKEEKL